MSNEIKMNYKRIKGNYEYLEGLKVDHVNFGVGKIVYINNSKKDNVRVEFDNKVSFYTFPDSFLDNSLFTYVDPLVLKEAHKKIKIK